jgi:hypothetical protein
MNSIHLKAEKENESMDKKLRIIVWWGDGES